MTLDTFSINLSKNLYCFINLLSELGNRKIDLICFENCVPGNNRTDQQTLPAEAVCGAGDASVYNCSFVHA